VLKETFNLSLYHFLFNRTTRRMFVINNPSVKKTWIIYSLTYIVIALSFGVIVYFLPGYQDPDPEIAYHLSFIQCIGYGFGFSFIIYVLFIFVLFLLSLFYKKPIRLFIKALLSLSIVVVVFISFGGASEQDKIENLKQTLAIVTLFVSVPYIEFKISKISKQVKMVSDNNS
jgi:hypothetical protein